MKTTVPTVCFDLPAISRFFRSCALTIATQLTTQVQWTTYRDSKVLNAIYTVLFWKEPPGIVEINTATASELDRKTDELHQQFLTAWVRKLATEGPYAAAKYVESIRLDQAVFGVHLRSALTSAFAISMSFRMTATMATLAGFPALRRCSYLALRSGLNRMATNAGI